MAAMTQELLRRVRYVTSAEGNPTAVQIDWDLWQQLRALLEKVAQTDIEVNSPVTLDKDAWDIFLSIASDAQPGNLRDAAARHDEYLYGPQP